MIIDTSEFEAQVNKRLKYCLMILDHYINSEVSTLLSFFKIDEK